MANLRGLLDKYKEDRFFQEVANGDYSPTLGHKSDVVIDVGALAGEFAAYIYDQSGVIYALEPYSEHFKELEENIKQFELDKIKPFKLALAGENATRTLVVQSRGGHTLGVTEPLEEIQAVTLATFMKEQKIDHVDILKIDIEDAEIEVFNSPDFAEVVDKIDLIIGEHLGKVHDIFETAGFTMEKHGVNAVYRRNNA